MTPLEAPRLSQMFRALQHMGANDATLFFLDCKQRFSQRGRRRFVEQSKDMYSLL